MNQVVSFSNWFAMSDNQAMCRVQTHDDPSAFSKILERWQKPIERLCARMTGDAHAAEDLAQEVFTRVYAKRKEYQPSSKFSTYLWRIALNICYDELRRIKRRHESSLEEDFELKCPDFQLSSTPACDLARQERAEWVREALFHLSENHRAVLVLKHYEGLKFREIAEILDLPEGTVKSRLFEALQQLRHILRRRRGEYDL